MLARSDRRRQVHDANIVATMLAHGEDRLLTMNPQRLPALRTAHRDIEP
jgi:hypothetical protein